MLYELACIDEPQLTSEMCKTQTIVMHKRMIKAWQYYPGQAGMLNGIICAL